MACVAFNGRLHDTVTETSFGPQCRDDDEAWALIAHIYRTQARDPRDGQAVVEGALEELRDGSAAAMPAHQRVLCACGSGLMFGVKAYSIGKTTTRCAACAGTEVPADRVDQIGRF